VTAADESDASTLVRWIESRRHAVEAALERYVPAPGAAPADRRAPPIVAEAMRYSLLAGGKRLRPLLALGAAEAVAERLGRPVEDAMELALPAACALEFIHTYSLVHDDLPAMDNDTMRRGRPTAHIVFGEGIAILAGDALLTDAFSLLAREPAQCTGVSADELRRRKLDAVAIVAEAAGAAGMVGGQTLDLLAVAPGAEPLDGAALREMHMRKTGALIIASSLAGAVMGGATAEQMEAVGRYALQVGLAFQIVDDILDVEGVEAEIGKTPGKDAAAGKPTYPSLYGLEESRRLAAECVTRAIAALDNAGLAGQLPAIARWVVGRSN
jgi:geranylgeranyl diphosphate synthase, type II